MREETGRIVVKFCYLGVFWSSVSECWWDWAESLIFIHSHSHFHSSCNSRKWGHLVSPRHHLVVLVWIKRIRTEGESNIPFFNPSDRMALNHWLFSQKKALLQTLNWIQNAPLIGKTLYMWRVGGMQVDGICCYRLLQRKVVEARLNYKRSYLWWFRNAACGDSTGSNGTEKDLVRLPSRHTWEKERRMGGLI